MSNVDHVNSSSVSGISSEARPLEEVKIDSETESGHSLSVADAPNGSSYPTQKEEGEEVVQSKDILFANLIELGFDELTSEIALRRTEYKGIDEAISWILERSNPSDLEDNDSSEEDEDESEEEEEEEMGAAGSSTVDAASAAVRMIMKNARTHKMVLVANMGLKMGTGKLAAQVGHATLAVYKQAMLNEEGQKGIESWTRLGQVKIVLKGESTEQLMDLYKEAKDKGLFAYLVQDAGYTQIPPGSRTVLGVFGPKEDVDAVCGKLRLL